MLAVLPPIFTEKSNRVGYVSILSTYRMYSSMLYLIYFTYTYTVGLLQVLYNIFRTIFQLFSKNTEVGVNSVTSYKQNFIRLFN